MQRVANVQNAAHKAVVIGTGLLVNVLSLAKMRGASQIAYESPRRPSTNGLESGATASAERGELKELLRYVKFLAVEQMPLECKGTEAAAEQALGVLHNMGRMWDL